MTDNEPHNPGPAAQDPLQSWIDRTWHLWCSDSHTHYATRGGILTDQQFLAGCEKTLAADTPEELVACIRSQPDAPKARV